MNMAEKLPEKKSSDTGLDNPHAIIKGSVAEVSGMGTVARITEEVNSPMCRICYSDEATCPGLVEPCACRGTMGHVHLSCLESWINSSRSTSCELCHQKYNVMWTSRHGPVMSLARFIWENSLKLLCVLAFLWEYTWSVVRLTTNFYRVGQVVFQGNHELTTGLFQDSSLDFVLVKILYYATLNFMLVALIHMDVMIARHILSREWKQWQMTNNTVVRVLTDT